MPSDNQTSHLQGLRRHADILERIARGIPLPEILEQLALMIESEGDEIRCGICVVDPNHGIVTGSFGPNLPTSFSRSLLGVDLKESAAEPCASAACKRETITVENIAADTRWVGTPWRDNCLEHGFQRCQSSPIMDSTGRIIGTFAVYFQQSDGRRSYPELSETAAHLASIAIERDRDEAALRDSKERLQLAVEGADLGTWDWNLRNDKLHWSDRCKRMFGIPNETKMTYQRFLAAVHPDDREHVDRVTQDSLRNRTTCSLEFRCVWPDHTVRWIAIIGKGSYSRDSPSPFFMRGVTIDITERKKSEMRLRANQEELRAALAAAELAREQAEAAAHAKDQFLAVLSHELRTPLTPVLMAVSAIGVQKSLPADVHEALDMIQRNIKMEARLIEDLLDLTRITPNKVQLYLEPVDLHVAVEQAMETCRSDIETKKQRVHSNLAAQNSGVSGDFARLQQVFWNLVKNAVKFTAEGGEIFIQSYNKDSQIFVAVSDTGVGIVPEVMSRIFNPFEQGEPGSVRQFGGLGLGLAISKATMEAHHGTLTARSKGRNQGATFTVGLAIVR